MAITLGDLIYRITGDTTQLQKGLKKSEQAVKKSSQVTQKGFGGIKASFVAATVALAAYVQQVFASIKAYAIQEQADIKLRKKHSHDLKILQVKYNALQL